MHSLKKEFFHISQKYTQDQNQINVLWEEIEKAYSGRAYHNLLHLHTMYTILLEVKEQIQDWDVLMYAMLYHDFVYNVSRNDNEKRSAELSKIALKKLAVPYNEKNKIYKLIMATKGYNQVLESDKAFFLDTDLAILALPSYEQYQKAIRQEYNTFSDEAYKKGRQKVIKHFLSQKRIYQSAYFFEKFEGLARGNLKRELKSLNP